MRNGKAQKLVAAGYRGKRLLRGVVCGLMTTAGGIGHRLPYLIPDFRTATAIAVVIVAIELLLISWIRKRFMDTPFLRAAFQVTVGGAWSFWLESGLEARSRPGAARQFCDLSSDTTRDFYYQGARLNPLPEGETEGEARRALAGFAVIAIANLKSTI